MSETENPKYPQPTCRYGHGPLTGAGYGATDASGKDLIRSTVLPTAIMDAGGYYNLDGQAYAFYTYRCTTCGYTELFDNDIRGQHGAP